MRTITKEITLYKYNELSDTAKECVKQWADTFEFASESVLEDFEQIAGILGFYDITPRYSGFWSQGDGASFTGRYKYAKGASKAIRDYAPQDTKLHAIADGLQALQARHFYKLRAVLTLGSGSNYYSHENTVSIEVSRDDNDAPESVQNNFKELARDLMRWLYKALEREWEHCNSDEYIAEHCTANGYEFTEKGEIA